MLINLICNAHKMFCTLCQYRTLCVFLQLSILHSCMVAHEMAKVAPSTSRLTFSPPGNPSKKGTVFPKSPRKVPAMINRPMLGCRAIPNPITEAEGWNILLGCAWIMGLLLKRWGGVIPRQSTWPKRFPKGKGAIPVGRAVDAG